MGNRPGTKWGDGCAACRTKKSECNQCSRRRYRKAFPLRVNHCPGCSQAFSQRSRAQRFCSRECQRKCQQKSRLRYNDCPVCGERKKIESMRCRRCSIAARKPAISSCPMCREPYYPWTKDWHRKKSCDDCRSELERQAKREAEEKSKPREINKECDWCGRSFVTTCKPQRYCREHCNNMAKKKRRDVRKRNNSRDADAPSLGYIFRRDGGICQLCSKPVQRDRYAWPDGRMPSLDHIVPVADGGSDKATNIQLAHLVCNLKKHTGRCGSQLRLLG